MANRRQQRRDGPRSGVLPAIVQAFAELGADVREILALAGLGGRGAALPISREAGNALWAAAVEITGDPDIGLHVGERMSFERLDLVGYLLRASRDGAEAARNLERYIPLLIRGLTIEVDIGPERVSFAQRWWDDGSAHRAFEEFALTTAYTLGGQVMGEPLQPSEVHFVHTEPPETREHTRVFGTSLRFAMPKTQMVFVDLREMVRLTSADPGLMGVLRRQAETLLEELPPGDDFVARVRACIADELTDGDASSWSVANSLGMSERTLRRRLDERRTGYQLLLDEVRRGLAVRYLQQKRFEIAEVSYLLGFSEPSAFHRAFRRWTGCTPAEVRDGSRWGR